MTVHVPKWLVWTSAVAIVLGLIVLAFALGRSSGDDSSQPDADAASQTMAKEAVCSKSTAESATLDADFADDIRAATEATASLEDSEPIEIPFFTEYQTDYQVAILECTDLTGDGVGEMVVGISAGAAGRIFQWAIFTPDRHGRWSMAFDRTLVASSSIEVQGDSVLVSTPSYGLKDALCCPSGHKTTQVAFRRGKFRVVSPVASANERLISIEEGKVTRIGLLRPMETTPSQAIAAFGTPTSITNYPSSSCNYSWGDLGLKLVFANFGGGGPCGEAGRIGSFELAGEAAEQAGWRTGEGARVGTTATALERLFPGATRTGAEMLLVETPSVIGADGTIDIATAFIVDGEARAYRFYVGAAGE